MMGMPSCKEVARAVASGSLEDASAAWRLGVRLHLMLCRRCRRYARQIRIIGRAARVALDRPIGEAESLERLLRALLDRIGPPPPNG